MKVDLMNPMPFLMSVQSVFELKNKDVTVNGIVQRGAAKVGDEVEILGLEIPTVTTKIAGIEISTADSTTLLFKGVKNATIEQGMMIAHAGSITTYSRFLANLYLLTSEEGGRQRPISIAVGYANANLYRPQFFVYGMDFACSILHPKPQEISYMEISHGEETHLLIQLYTPVALEIGTEFKIREGSQVVGKGVITEILD